MKKWTVFCPLVGELRDPAMRQRHWAQLMDQKLGAICQGQPTGPYPHHQNNGKGITLSLKCMLRGEGVGCATYIVPGSDLITGEFLAYNFEKGGGSFLLKDRRVQLLQTLF